MFLKFNYWPFLAGLLVITSLYGFHTYDKHVAVKEAITQTKSDMNTEYQKKLNISIAASQATQIALQNTADKEKNEKDIKIKNLNTRLDAALIELRIRPKRSTPTNNPSPSTIEQACTGTQLYGEDAEFLTREAARADSVIAERDYYYRAYEFARNELESLSSKKK